MATREHQSTQHKGRQEGRQGRPNPIQIQKHLGGLKSPASKEDILEKAREEGTDEAVAVIDFLEQISDREYESPVAISRDMSGKRYTQEDDDDGQGNRGKRSHRRATRTKGRQAAGR
jgi:hypothetical protein